MILLYDSAPTTITSGPKAGESDPKKVSSIEKNKAYTYQSLLKKYQEIYYTGDDKAYDKELDTLQMYLERMAECLNNALYFGTSCQDDQWIAGVI